MRKKPWAEGEVAENPMVIESPEMQAGKWQAIFGDDHPVFVEIGMGKGAFLLENARRNPEKNFVGIEKQISVMAIAARRLREAKVNNVRLVCGDGANLESMFAPDEIEGIFINFCDPWPKKRWAKRRLTHRSFLESYNRILMCNGQIRFKTDNKELFEFSLNEFLEMGWQVREVSLDLHKKMPVDADNPNIMTEYEKKFSEAGNPIYSLAANCQKRQ